MRKGLTGQLKRKALPARPRNSYTQQILFWVLANLDVAKTFFPPLTHPVAPMRTSMRTHGAFPFQLACCDQIVSQLWPKSVWKEARQMSVFAILDPVCSGSRHSIMRRPPNSTLQKNRSRLKSSLRGCR